MREHLVFFGIRPWCELVRFGFYRASGATFGCLLGEDRFSRLTYVYFESRWGSGVRVELIGASATAVGLPRGLPLGRFGPVRRANRRLQARLLSRELARAGPGPRLFWLHDWWNIEIASRLGPGRCLVECQDDPRQVFADSASRLAEVPAQRAAALARADLVVAVDPTLLSEITDGSPRFAVAPNGISAAFLEAGARSGVPAEPAELARAARPRLVVVAGEWSFEKRVDHALLGAVMDRLAGWSLVLVGVPPKPGASLARLLARPQVVALEPRPYLDLVPLLRSCDVGAVPYRVAGGRDVLKTYEYLACGLPVVTTFDEPRPELSPWVARAEGAEAFAAACRTRAREGLADRERLAALLAAYTWEGRTRRLLALLDAARPPEEP